jgi:aspartokinase
MSASTVISTVSNITLVTLQGFPANVATMSKIFDAIASFHINIDMISMAPTQGAFTGMSFTISDNDLIDILSFTSALKKETDIKVIVSSVNHKISVHDPAMKNTPGIAAKVFHAISDTNADIRLITTSEVEISFLVTEADFDTVLNSLQKAMQD